jgi:hypothetical protein
MANLYPYFGSGTFEAYPNPYAMPPFFYGVTNPSFGRQNEAAYEGSYSLGCFFSAPITDLSYNLFFSVRGPFYPIVLTPGKNYRIKCKVMTPTVGKLGTDGVKIWIGDEMTNPATFVLVGGIVDVWTEIYFDWTEPATGTPGYRVPISIGIETRGGEDINGDGKLYIDKLELEEVIGCDLAFDSPASVINHESAEDANDGQITVNVTSSFTPEYSISGAGGPWQSSNVFSGLAPGFYTIHIRDTNPAGCTQTLGPIQVIEFSYPPCSLQFLNAERTNETVLGANDGTFTITASTNYGPIEYAIQQVSPGLPGPVSAWQSSNVFTGLAPGGYRFFLKDGNPSVCQLEIPTESFLSYSINAGPPPVNPDCDLTWTGAGYSKTNESGSGLDDGTITGVATSSFLVEYAIQNEGTGLPDPVVWQSSGLFSGLAPGTYTLFTRDNNPESCELQINGIVIGDFDIPVAPMAINATPVNSNNLVPWFAASGHLNFSSESISDCCYDIPAAYRARTRGKNNLRHAFIVCNGEEFTFYMNFDTPINNPDFATWKLALVTEAGLVPGQENIAPLVKHLYPDGVSYNIYAAVTLIGITVDRYYKLVIYNDDDEILYVSGLLEVLSLADAKCLSTRLRYRASINLYNFNYSTLTTFYNIHRVRLYRVDEQDEATITQYRAVSSGQLRNVHYDADRWIMLEAYFFDDTAHRAIGVLQLHDAIYLNDKGYLVKSPYKRQFDREKTLYKGVIEMYEIAFSTKNRYNRLGGEAIITNSDLILGDDGDRIRY